MGVVCTRCCFWCRFELAGASESHALWVDFVQNFERSDTDFWKEQRFWAPTQWQNDMRPLTGSLLHVFSAQGQHWILSPEGQYRILLSYLGPEDRWQF